MRPAVRPPGGTPRRFRLADWAAAAQAAFLAAVGGKRTPLAVSYIITNRCNSQCAYCDRWKKADPGLSTEQACDLLAGLRRLGTRFLQITGGEPFLREDLAVVVRRARELSLHTGVNTNGSLLKANAGVLRHLDRLCLSLDGPPEVHEKIRPKGAHWQVEEAIAIAADHGVPVSLNVTLTRFNTAHVDYLLDFAAAKGVAISFQPADVHALSSARPNEAAGDRDEVRRAFGRLEERKRDRARMENGFLELSYMRKWPGPQGVCCAGGRLFFRIESNGDVMVCGLKERGGEFPNVLRDGLEAALEAVPFPDCDACFSSTRLRINLLYSALRLNRGVILDWLGGRRP
ncbi:MAG: radical SAM protein [Elusimicrobia bacterium]|nr:radical SAM protein [Elusimicrobiota bacterium]